MAFYTVGAARFASDAPRPVPRRSAHPPRTTAIPPLAIVTGAAVIDAFALAIAGGGGLLASPAVLGPNDAVTVLASGGAFLLIGLARGDYRTSALLEPRGQVARVSRAWLAAIFVALVAGFMTRASATMPREATAILAVAGFVGLPLLRVAVSRFVCAWAAAGRVVLRRIMVLGSAAELDGFLARHTPERYGLRLVNAAVLRAEDGTLDEDLALAIATGRLRRPDDVYLLLPWTEPGLIARSIEALQRLPAAIHLGPTAMLEQYEHLAVDRAGPITSVRMVRQPLTATDLRYKRVFDIACSLAALAVLAPVFAAIAIAIKCDSPGPVFFRQRRTGFNQQPFRIIKFRSMRTMEDGAGLRQVTKGDPRVTRVGRLLRRTSLDELPQLLNVLRGEMSLIGPRPHALAHDIAFGRAHALYPRRHVMRPGITGWAQVSGFRGETDTPDKIAGRVRHDLAYVDNWSLLLDLQILLKTVFSPKTFQGAR